MRIVELSDDDFQFIRHTLIQEANALREVGENYQRGSVERAKYFAKYRRVYQILLQLSSTRQG